MPAENRAHLSVLAPAENPRRSLDPLTQARLEAVMSLWLPARLSKSTHRQYRAALDHFLQAAGCSELMDAFRDEGTALQSIASFYTRIENMAPASRRLYLTALRKLVIIAEDCALIPFKVHQYIDLPNTKPEYIYPDDVPSPDLCRLAILYEPDPCNAWAYRLMYYMALRTSEVCDLRWENLKVVGSGDDAPLCFQVTGKGSTTPVTVPKALLEEVKLRARAAGRTGLVCPTRQGGRYSRQRLYKASRRAWLRAGYVQPEHLGIGEGGHLWRHCHASHAKAAGVDKEILRVTMRHRSEKTQEVYIHVAPPSSGDWLG